jgi:PPOX class probable F420-dependent enzyme
MPAMATIPDSARELLTTGLLGHVVTLNEDGTPHVTLTWAGFEGDELVFSTFFHPQRKTENLRRDPRVTVSFQAKEHHGAGLWPYLVVQGRARIEEGGALELMDRLAEFYIGPGAKYPQRDVVPGLVMRVAVERIYGVGPWGTEL